MEISLTQQALLYLLNCAVNERIPEELPHDVDFEGLYKISKFHSVSAMVSYALDKGGYLSETYMSQDLIQKWAMARIHAMRKNLMYDAEREQILQWMEEQGCWYMPLKGVILKEMYPDVGMREMCDNDILFDKKFREQLKECMVKRGYKVSSYKVFIDDVYMKKPMYNFEFHTELFNDSMLPKWFDYYKNVIERLKKDADNMFGYHFNNEDFYIYMIAHGAKHYRESGTGIRFLADQNVYLRHKNDSMDWKYINEQLIKLEIEEFEKDSKELSKKIFDASVDLVEFLNFDKKECKMLSYLMNSGTYGTITNKVKNELSDINEEAEKINLWAKINYLFGRIFPGMEHMKKFEPFIYEHKWLIPFFWIYRIAIRAPFMKSKSILAEFRSVMKVK